MSCERRGIQPFTFYGLCRLRVDTLQRQGIEASVYERIMGHSTRMAQEVYRTPNAQDLQDVVEADVESGKGADGDAELLMALVKRLGMEEVLRAIFSPLTTMGLYQRRYRCCGP